MADLVQYGLARVKAVLRDPEEYDDWSLNQRLPRVGDVGTITDVIHNPGDQDQFVVEMTEPGSASPIWLSIFVKEELEPVNARILPGLPSSGPMATAFPTDWGRLGGEGTIVEFQAETGTWVGNFKPGLFGLEYAGHHPDGERTVVISSGDLWVVDPNKRTAKMLLPAIEAAFEVQDPKGWIYSRQGIALARLGPRGLMWHTRRLSWDGFDGLVISKDQVKGLGWSPIDEQWYPFSVDTRTGESQGGSFSLEDAEGWERLTE